MKTKTQYPVGSWTLHSLETSGPETRWSVGVNGPRAYLTCDEETARLIAAAQDLLEAAKAIKTTLDKRKYGSRNPGELEGYFALCDAIAKAEGK